MSEYISREAALNNSNILVVHTKEYGSIEAIPVDSIAEIPVADVEPVKHGEWLNFCGDYSTAECNQCGELYEVSPDEKPNDVHLELFKQEYRFCPNCGARMDGDNNER